MNYMKRLNLIRFYGIDRARLNADGLDTTRYAFAAAVGNFAAICRDSPLHYSGRKALLSSPASEWTEHCAGV
jgi:hypothetical protein